MDDVELERERRMKGVTKTMKIPMLQCQSCRAYISVHENKAFRGILPYSLRQICGITKHKVPVLMSKLNPPI